MYTFLTLLQYLAYLAIIVVAGLIVWPILREKLPEWQAQQQHLAKKRELGAIPVPDSRPLTLETEDAITPREAAKRTLKLLGIPSVNAGGMVLDVPQLNPEATGEWQKDREVITVSRAMAYTRQGKDPVEIIELRGGFLLVAAGGKPLIMTNHHLTTQEETELEKQRQAAVDSGDMVIEEFAGDTWDISGAFGTNVTQKPGERACSFIQVLDVNPKLGEGGMKSVLPPKVLDGTEHDYYDMRARNRDTGQIMFFFYTSGRWNLFIGRFLDDTEVSQLRGV